jgi:hypothetical protein
VGGTEGQKAEWLPYYKEAQALEKAGRMQEAEQQYQVVLDICCDSSEGKETVAVATARRDLGRVLALQKKFDRAEEQYKVCALCARMWLSMRGQIVGFDVFRLLWTCVPVCWGKRIPTPRVLLLILRRFSVSRVSSKMQK